MRLLFVLLAAVSGVIFLVAPFWVALAYLVVIGWSAFLLDVVFNWPDPVSRAVAEHGGPEAGNAGALERR